MKKLITYIKSYQEHAILRAYLEKLGYIITIQFVSQFSKKSHRDYGFKNND
jgi:hypothetical protein